VDVRKIAEEQRKRERIFILEQNYQTNHSIMHLKQSNPISHNRVLIEDREAKLGGRQGDS